MLKRLKEIGMVCALKKFKHTLFLDEDAKNVAARHGAYEYLLRYSAAAEYAGGDERQKAEARKVIWTCWLQGYENAPLIVKKCIGSMRKYANGYEVVVIDAENLSRYVQLPEYIHEKYRRGIIPPAHYSDLIRLALLNEYGGIWIDSTILLTDILPNYITESEFFAFRSEKKEGKTCIYNPFLVSRPHHPLTKTMLNLLNAYWRMENRLVSYSIFHLFFTMSVETVAENRRLWEKVPLAYGGSMFHLQPQLGKTYDANAYILATRLSSIHKLTYKFKQFGIDTEKKGTFYDILTNGEGR